MQQSVISVGNINWHQNSSLTVSFCKWSPWKWHDLSIYLIFEHNLTPV